MQDKLSRITSYLLLLFSGLLLMTLGIIYICCDNKQIHSVMLIILLGIVGIDLIISIIKIGKAGILKWVLYFIPFGIPLALAFILHDYGASLICAGLVIGVLDIANIIFYAWNENVEVTDVYESTEPGLDIYKKSYTRFNDFATLPTRTWVNFLINLPSRILILALSIYVGANDKYIDGEGYYNYWDKTTSPWSYETGQRKLLDPGYLKAAGIIYIIASILYLLVFVYFIVKVIVVRKKLKNTGSRNNDKMERKDIEKRIKESIKF